MTFLSNQFFNFAEIDLKKSHRYVGVKSEVLNITNPQVENMFAKNYLAEPLIPITIIYHDTEMKMAVPHDTVGNTLKYVGIHLEENDVLPFDENDYIFSYQTISIPKIETKQVQLNEKISFQTEIILSEEMLDGEKQVIQQGQNGEKCVTYFQQYFNDKLWFSNILKETIITPVQNEIIVSGTQNIIEYPNVDLTNENSVLLKTKYDDENFYLPKVTLSEKDRDLLERIVTGEFGNSFVGSCLIAQAIKCAIVYDHYTSIADLIIGMGYVGDTDQKSQNAVDAAKFIFDENGLAVKHRLFYMCTEDYYNSEPGNFHSTQNFILQYENVKFFDRW